MALKANEDDRNTALTRLFQGQSGERTVPVDHHFRRANATWMKVIRAKYQGAVIRRTGETLDIYGKAISGLEPFEEHICMLQLFDHEYESLQTLAEKSMNDKSIARRFSSEVCHNMAVAVLHSWALTCGLQPEFLFRYTTLPVAPMLRERHGGRHRYEPGPLFCLPFLQDWLTCGDPSAPSCGRWRTWHAAQSR
jgi:hypothetical protein